MHNSGLDSTGAILTLALESIGKLKLTPVQISQLFPEVRAKQALSILQEVTEEGTGRIREIVNTQFSKEALGGAYEEAAEFMINTTENARKRAAAEWNVLGQNIGKG